MTDILDKHVDELDLGDWMDLVGTRDPVKPTKTLVRPILTKTVSAISTPSKLAKISKVTGVQGKQKGNAFENKTAKQLGLWIFNDENAFSRSITSGAKKAAYYGDIIPLKQLGWREFPFIIEVKNGYKNALPSMMNWTLLSEWLIKYNDECVEAKDLTGQYVLFLICGFHNYSPLMFTNIELHGIHSQLLLRPYDNDPSKVFYCYDFKKLWECDFYELFPQIQLKF